mmetsp:Transcript_32860/g.53688  ORF Transcript_32860/g.53688 Transcript_32860/m.53688 type:complete len:93 (-) Transcript_32860:215-493(-)
MPTSPFICNVPFGWRSCFGNAPEEDAFVAHTRQQFEDAQLRAHQKVSPAASGECTLSRLQNVATVHCSWYVAVASTTLSPTGTGHCSSLFVS